MLYFGISKLLGVDESDENTSLTALGAMTPEYASPEQIRGETMTTATDIYSLGVILYKILAGSLPYDFKGKTNGELLRIITESEPVSPSSFVLSPSQFNKDEKQITTDGGQRAKLLRGDLDNIVLKALSKEPPRRYKTVEEFSDDIWRYMDGSPVAARPSTFSCRASNFFRRNRISVIAAVLVVSSLVGGIAVAFWQARTARAAQTVAEKEEGKAKKISDFMTKIIAYGSPHWLSPGYKYKGETKIVEALLELGDQIDVEFAGHPEVQADLHLKFADALHFHVGDEFIKKKRFHVARALELTKQIHGDYHEQVAVILYAQWAALPTDDPQAKILMETIRMMRGTNPNNLNLPYMYLDYFGRLLGFDDIPLEEAVAHQIESNVRIPSREEVRAMYRQAVQPPTGENDYQIAERMLREAMPVFRVFYKNNNFAVVATECNLSYVLAKQNKWTDFDERFQACKQGASKVPDDSLKTYKKGVEIIEKLSAKRNTQD